MRKIRVGVVGLGNMGRNHVRTYLELEDQCELVAVVDTNKQLGQNLANEWALCFFEDYHSIFRKLDAVSIAVPTRLHHQIACEFLEHGIHCIIEKPMAISLEGAQQIVDTANKNNVTAVAGQIERFNPSIVRLKDFLGKGGLGPIYMMVSSRVGPHPVSDIPESIILDLAIHDLDMARYLLNREACSLYSRMGNPNTCIISLDFEGVLTTIHASWDIAVRSRNLKVFCRNGTAEVDYMRQTLTVNHQEGLIQLPVDRQLPLKQELSHFLRCVAGLQTPLASASDGLKTLSLAFQAEERTTRDTRLSSVAI